MMLLLLLDSFTGLLLFAGLKKANCVINHWCNRHKKKPLCICMSKCVWIRSVNNGQRAHIHFTSNKNNVNDCQDEWDRTKPIRTHTHMRWKEGSERERERAGRIGQATRSHSHTMGALANVSKLFFSLPLPLFILSNINTWNRSEYMETRIKVSTINVFTENSSFAWIDLFPLCGWWRSGTNSGKSFWHK